MSNRMPSPSRRAPLIAMLLAALLTLALVGGCAEARDPIDRVQPNVVQKSSLAGQWYYQRTVVDVPSANGFTFVGNTDHSGLQKVKFDIQEAWLFVRRNTELIDGADDKSTKGDAYEGEVVGAFPIVSHFDIRHAYNPTTGEELNVLEENSVDRPWYERAYMRVDWSKNNVTNYQLDFESKSIEPVPYFVQRDDPDGPPHPDEPHFVFGVGADRSDAKVPNDPDELRYFDITSRIFAKAGTIEYPPYGTIPVCWLLGEETSECGAGEYAIRHSFKRIDPSHQYIPQPYKGPKTELFGFFTVDRKAYDDKLGIKYPQQKRYLQRHNIWQAWQDAAGAAIPMAKREPRPVVYHVNAEFPDDLKPIAKQVGEQWNKVFKRVVSATGNPYAGDMFITCLNNPVRDGDPKECGAAGNSPRLGDIRYSFMAFVPKYMKYGLLGLGPSNNDPETGEIISGMAYMYHHNNTAAWRTTEMIELLNGTRSAEDFIDGVDLTDWLEQVQSGNGRFEQRDLEQAKTMVERATHSPYDKYWQGRREAISEADQAFMKEQGTQAWIDNKLTEMHAHGHLNGEAFDPQAKMARLKGSELEKKLMHPELKLHGGFSPDAAVDEPMLDALSPSRLSLLRKSGALWKIREEVAASRNMYLPEMADDALLGLAREVKGKSSDEIWKTVKTSVYTAVFAHEVGHSLGLMHNFGGSDDVVNYFDEYWKLRDDGKMGPRITDPITDAELDGKIYNYAYSSVMDYAGRYTIDGLGVGKYDQAAMLFGYANKVEVFNDPGKAPYYWRDWFRQRGELLYFLGGGPTTVHYTSVYKSIGTKMYEAENRFLVDVDALSAGLDKASVDGKDYYRVPYIYCSHGRSDLGDSCLTRDYGADSMERMQHQLQEWDTWYITRAFPRGDMGVFNHTYAGRYYRRIYHRIKQWHDIYGLYSALLPRYYDSGTLKLFFLNPISGFGTTTWAVQNAFQYLVETILMPDIGQGGPYSKVIEPDGSKLWKLNSAGSGSLQLGVADARYYSTNWTFSGANSCGYFWNECLHHIGFYIDKIMAMEAISDSQTNYVARASPIDIRDWHVSYYNTFGENIRRLNAALQSGDWSRVGPYVDKGKLRFPNYSGELTDVHADAVDPAADFTVQLYFALLGLANFQTNYDRRFTDEARIWVHGTGSAPTLPSEATVAFSDPWTGLVYGALDIKGASGAAIIGKANTLKSRSNHCDAKTATHEIADDCVAGLAETARNAADAALAKYVQLLQGLSEMHFTLEYGDAYNP